MIVDINGQVIVPAPGVRTVGDLLRQMDGQVAARDEVVTALRLDGVDEPDFRAPAVVGRRLESLRAISFDSDTPAGLARRCVGDAALALDDLIRATRTAADGFRREDIVPAKATLEQISQSLLGVIRIVAVAHGALRGAIEAADAGERSLAALSANLDRIVAELTASQQNEDWIQVADLLQYELAPALGGWQATLAEVAAS